MTTELDEHTAWKTAAAEAAVEMVDDGMIVGLGSGSTAAIAVGLLARRVTTGLRIIGIPTSERTAREARRLGIPLSTLDEHDRIDLTIDGADEVEIGTLALLKGHGGALLREKIIASVSRQLIIVVDETKIVERLGVTGLLAVDVVPFGWQTTAARLQAIVTSVTARTRSTGGMFVTDDGHYVLDCACGGIADAAGWQRRLDDTVGVVEHGLFTGLASRVIVGGSGGVRVLKATRLR
jgi:ribose 5-phosphate isomerase A